jgi:hypothetical protein
MRRIRFESPSDDFGTSRERSVQTRRNQPGAVAIRVQLLVGGAVLGAGCASRGCAMFPPFPTGLLRRETPQSKTDNG